MQQDISKPVKRWKGLNPEMKYVVYFRKIGQSKWYVGNPYKSIESASKEIQINGYEYVIRKFEGSNSINRYDNDSVERMDVDDFNKLNSKDIHIQDLGDENTYFTFGNRNFSVKNYPRYGKSHNGMGKGK